MAAIFAFIGRIFGYGSSFFKAIIALVPLVPIIVDIYDAFRKWMRDRLTARVKKELDEAAKKAKEEKDTSGYDNIFGGKK